MSVELRIVCDRPDDCTLGIAKPAGFTDHCHHRMECDWGAIRNSEADPRLGIEHLMLIGADYVQRMLFSGPHTLGRTPGVGSATADGDRLFFHLEHEGQRWTWELFEAHWWDGNGPDDILIGRWPD